MLMASMAAEEITQQFMDRTLNWKNQSGVVPVDRSPLLRENDKVSTVEGH